MNFDVVTLEGSPLDKIDLSESVFGLEPRSDLLHRYVRWQLAKRQAGTHKTLGRSEVARTGKKLYKQKGTGRARHGSARVPQFRGGGRAFGPVVRSHAHDLPKKVRRLAVRHALSAKYKAQELIIVDQISLKEAKTKTLMACLKKLNVSNALVIFASARDENFLKAAVNLPSFDVLPVAGINVYDILRRRTLILEKEAVALLEARLK